MDEVTDAQITEKILVLTALKLILLFTFILFLIAYHDKLRK